MNTLFPAGHEKEMVEQVEEVEESQEREDELMKHVEEDIGEMKVWLDKHNGCYVGNEVLDRHSMYWTIVGTAVGIVEESKMKGVKFVWDSRRQSDLFDKAYRLLKEHDKWCDFELDDKVKKSSERPRV